MIRRIAINERGSRIGECHQRARISDHDVSLIVGLLNARLELIEQMAKLGHARKVIELTLCEKQLSYRWIALKMEVGRTTVRDIEKGRVRCQYATRWKVGGAHKPDSSS